jgi:2,4-dienoyl-CoA reductase-like NADH-dependent reductase (Old Yellow Enzyme family)
MLAKPIKIGSLEVKNRIVRAAMTGNLANEKGEVTDRLIEYYQRQTQGGAGLLITGGAYIQKSGRSARRLIGAYDDNLIPGHSRLTKAVHELEGKIILQVYHCGRQTQPELVDGDVIGPSPVKDRMMGVTPRSMTEEEIEATIKAFGKAARRAEEANYDGIEIMAAHGYLISQFLSNRTNQRTDQWGGSIENRGRFLFRIIKQVKVEVSDGFPLLVKLNTEDKLKKGLTLEESAWLAEHLPDLGVDAIEFSGGTYESGLNITRGDLPIKDILEEYSGLRKLQLRFILRLMKKRFQFSEAYFLENLKSIRPRVRVPVILVGGLRTPAVMEQILREKHADLIALGRPLNHNPDFPKEILSGDFSPSSCLNCNRCFIRIIQEKPLQCYASKENE